MCNACHGTLHGTLMASSACACLQQLQLHTHTCTHARGLGLLGSTPQPFPLTSPYAQSKGLHVPTKRHVPTKTRMPCWGWLHIAARMSGPGTASSMCQHPAHAGTESGKCQHPAQAGLHKSTPPIIPRGSPQGTHMDVPASRCQVCTHCQRSAMKERSSCPNHQFCTLPLILSYPPTSILVHPLLFSQPTTFSLQRHSNRRVPQCPPTTHPHNQAWPAPHRLVKASQKHAVWHANCASSVYTWVA